MFINGAHYSRSPIDNATKYFMVFCRVSEVNVFMFLEKNNNH
jgi:hypothetical protein